MKEKETLVQQCLDILKRDDVFKTMLKPIIEFVLNEFKLYIYVAITLTFLIFLLLLAILLLLLRNKHYNVAL
jgi:hypothetical protein